MSGNVRTSNNRTNRKGSVSVISSAADTDTVSTKSSTLNPNSLSTFVHLRNIDINDSSMNHTGSTIFPSRRIDDAIESELKAKVKIIDLQVIECVKLNKEINLLMSEIEALRVLVDKKQTEINRLNCIIDNKSTTIEEQSVEIHSLQMDKRAYKLMEDQNKLLFEKLQVYIKDKEEISSMLKKTIEEDKHLKTIGTQRFKNSVQEEVKMAAKNVSLEAQLSKLTTEKEIVAQRCASLEIKLAAASQQVLFIKETSDDKIARSRQTEYKTLQRLNELHLMVQEAKDEREIMHESFQLACERGDMLQKRIQKAVDSSNNSFVLLNTVVDHIEAKYAEKVKEMKVLKMKADKLQMNYNVSRKAVDVMIRKDKIHNRNDSLTITMGRVPNMVKRSTEELGGNKTAAPDMLFSNATFPAGDLASTRGQAGLCSPSPSSPTTKLGVTFASFSSDKPEKTRRSSDQVSDIIAIAPSEVENGRKKLLSRYLQYCIPVAPTIDLSHCQITDEDMPSIIEWLRVLTCKASQEIVFRNNKITEIGFRLLMIWMIALSREEILRSKPLLLDLRYNLISDEAIMNSLTQIKALERKEISLTTTEGDGNKIIVVYAPSGMISGLIESTDGDIASRSRAKRSKSKNDLGAASGGNTFGNQCVVRIDCRHNTDGNSVNLTRKKSLLSQGIADSIYDNKLLYSGTPLDTETPSKLKTKTLLKESSIASSVIEKANKSLSKSLSATNITSTSRSAAANNDRDDVSVGSVASSVNDIVVGPGTGLKASSSSSSPPVAPLNRPSNTGANTKYIEYNGVEIEPSDITIPRDGIMSIRPEFIELFPIHQKY